MSKLLRTRLSLIVALAIMSTLYGSAIFQARSHHIISLDVMTIACLSMIYTFMIFFLAVTHLGARGDA